MTLGRHVVVPPPEWLVDWKAGALVEVDRQGKWGLTPLICQAQIDADLSINQSGCPPVRLEFTSKQVLLCSAFRHLPRVRSYLIHDRVGWPLGDHHLGPAGPSKHFGWIMLTQQLPQMI